MKPHVHRKMLVGTLAQSVFLASMGTSMANLALPSIANEFAIDFSKARLVILSYLAATTLFTVAAGRLADLRGRFQTLILGTVLFVVATAIAASANAYWLLVGARLLQGIGAAALVVLPIVIGSDAATSGKFGRIVGLLATMSAVGTASGPSIGGLILEAFGWRSVFLVMFLLGLLNLILLLVLAPENTVETRSVGEKLGFTHAALAVMGDSSLLKQLLFNLAVSAVMMTTLVVGPFYLTNHLRLTPAAMGLVMSAGPLTSIVSGLLSGYAVDYFGAPKVILAGFIQLFLGTMAFVFLPDLFGAIGFAISALLLSLGYQLFLSANSKSIMESAASERRGLVSGALSLSRNLGLIVGTSVLGRAFDIFGFEFAFGAAAVLVAASLFIHLISEQRSGNGTRFTVQVY